MAFDFGTQKIGVALGQTLTSSARPIATLKAHAGKPNWEALFALYEKWRPDHIAVGLPLNMDGSESDSSERARKFARRLNNLINKPIDMIDERLSSFDARDRIKLNRQHSLDAHAATLIAEAWLNQHAHAPPEKLMAKPSNPTPEKTQ